MTTDTCTHAWEIETADGPMSVGRCRNCGEQGEFQNFIDADQYESGATKAARAQARALAKKGNKLDTEAEIAELELTP